MEKLISHVVEGENENPLIRTHEIFKQRNDEQKLQVDKARKLFNSLKLENGDISEEKFVIGFSSFLNKSIEELRLLFAQIDVEARGSINWSMLSTFLFVGDEHSFKPTVEVCFLFFA